MIVWVNGAFGVGKSTLPDEAREWRHRHVDAALAATADLRGEPDTVILDASGAADAVADRIVAECTDPARRGGR
jgi:hypothetical protein